MQFKLTIINERGTRVLWWLHSSQMTWVWGLVMIWQFYWKKELDVWKSCKAFNRNTLAQSQDSVSAKGFYSRTEVDTIGLGCHDGKCHPRRSQVSCWLQEAWVNYRTRLYWRHDDCRVDSTSLVSKCWRIINNADYLTGKLESKEVVKFHKQDDIGNEKLYINMCHANAKSKIQNFLVNYYKMIISAWVVSDQQRISKNHD